MTPQDLIIMIASITGGLTVISGFLYAIYRIARRLDDAVGVDAQGRTIADRLSRVEHQLWKNGGDSLADHVEELRTSSTETTTELRLLKDMMLRMLSAGHRD